MTLDEARTIALSLPGATEEPAVGVAVGIDPETFEELHWGKKLAGVAVELARADPDVVRDLLEESWRRRATKRLIRELDARRDR